MRAFSAASVDAGDELDVTISGTGFSGTVSGIKETLPAGFSYVDGSATSAQGGVRASTAGQVVTFTVLGTRLLHVHGDCLRHRGEFVYFLRGSDSPCSGADQPIGGDSSM